MSLPQGLKTLLGGVDNVSTSNITYGTRNQSASLPAVCFNITRNDRMTVGASSPIFSAEVQIKSIAETAETAQQLGEDVEDEFVNGVYDNITIIAVVNKNTILETPDNAFGDETTPFTATTTAEFYYIY